MKIFFLSPPTLCGGALEVENIPDQHRAGDNMLFLNDFDLQRCFTSENSSRP